MEKSFISVAFIGEKSTGKTSTLGRLLAEVAPQPNFSEVFEEAEKAGKADSKYAWLVDSSEEERQAGATATLHKAFLDGKVNRFVVKDTPGGTTKEALAAAATSKAVVIFIDSNKFDEFQSNSFNDYRLVLIGYDIKQFIFAINTQDRDQDKFDQIAKSVRNFIGSKIKIRSEVKVVAINSATGENINTRSAASQPLSWYKGMTLIEAMDTLLDDSFKVKQTNLRLAVDTVRKVPGEGTAFDMISLFGEAKIGAKVRICPGSITTELKNFVEPGPVGEHTLRTGGYGSIIVKSVSASDPNAAPGSILSLTDGDPCKVVDSSTVFIDFAGEPSSTISKGQKFTMHIHNAAYPVILDMISETLDKRLMQTIETFDEEYGGAYDVPGDSAIHGVIIPQERATYEEIQEYPKLARFILTDDGKIVGIGVVKDNLYNFKK